MFSQVLRALLRRFQVAVFAGQQVGRGKAIDHARNRIRLLAGALDLLAFQRQVRAIVAVIDHAIGELRVEIEVGERADLLDPPVGCSRSVFIGLRPARMRCLASNRRSPASG